LHEHAVACTPLSSNFSSARTHILQQGAALQNFFMSQYIVLEETETQENQLHNF
jgi:hypothetical protein